MAISAFLHGHYVEYFDDLVEYTRKKPTSPQEALLKVEVRKRPVSRAKIPNAAALKRLCEITREASMKYRKGKKFEQEMDGIERTPVKRKMAKNDPDEMRKQMLLDVGDELESDGFQEKFAGSHIVIGHEREGNRR